MASLGRVLARAAKLQTNHKTSKEALAPAFEKIDQAMTALSKKKTAVALRLVGEARIELTQLKAIKVPKRGNKKNSH